MVQASTASFQLARVTFFLAVPLLMSVLTPVPQCSDSPRIFSRVLDQAPRFYELKQHEFIVSDIKRHECHPADENIHNMEAPLPSRLEPPISYAVRSHRVSSHRTCAMICMVDVWSCALGVNRQSVGLGHECSSPSHSRHRIPSLIPIAFHTRRTVFHNAHPIAVLRFQFAWTCLPRSLLLPSKSW